MFHLWNSTTTHSTATNQSGTGGCGSPLTYFNVISKNLYDRVGKIQSPRSLCTESERLRYLHHRSVYGSHVDKYCGLELKCKDTSISAFGLLRSSIVASFGCGSKLRTNRTQFYESFIASTTRSTDLLSHDGCSCCSLAATPPDRRLVLCRGEETQA